MRALDVALVAKNATVASDSLYGCETLCSNHGDVPADAVCGADVVEWTFDERVVLGERAWLALVEDERHTRTRGAEPAAKTRWHLYGYACGSLKPVLTIAATAGEGREWSARATSKDGKRAEVFVAEGEMRATTKPKPKRFAWSDASCAFVPSK